MEQNTYKTMWLAMPFWKKVLTVVIIAFIISTLCKGFMHRGYRGDVAQDVITISGKGELSVKPDIATVSFGVREENMDVAKASEVVNTKIANIVAALKALGIDEKDIKTTDYGISPRYDYVQASIYIPGRQVLAGYVVSQNISLKIRDLAKAGQIVTELGKLGVTDMSGLNFTNDKYDELVKEARDEAIKNARMEAKSLAKSLGVRLVKIVGYSEGGYAPYPMYARAEAAYGMGGDAMKDAVLPTGENKIVSNVSITYKIK